MNRRRFFAMLAGAAAAAHVPKRPADVVVKDCRCIDIDQGGIRFPPRGDLVITGSIVQVMDPL